MISSFNLLQRVHIQAVILNACDRNTFSLNRWDPLSEIFVIWMQFAVIFYKEILNITTTGFLGGQGLTFSWIHFLS